jgi:hypothetical protein
MPTNFDLAPPAVALPGGSAVPIDIQAVDAAVTIDAAAGTAGAQATVTFVTGPVSGKPVFDLRQPITSLVLDGAALAATAAPLTDLGGGADAQMRVLDAVLAPGTTHTLVVGYTLGAPLAPGGGSYPPVLSFSAGPRVRWSFGFTDLKPARYLEAWVPANLVFDQLALTLTVEVLGTAVAHRVITNAAVTTLGPNHWRLAFPSRFTALSTLFELRAADTVSSATSTVTLPGSAAPVTIEVTKPTGSTVNLATQLANLATWLTENASAIGPYLHGDRFVAHLEAGGMEYEGGTTAVPDTLRHECHHSWWARGVKPASQSDGWFDEGWTTYHDTGGTGSTPFDLTDPPVTLCNRNGWSRVTPTTAYGGGAAVFEGVAAAVGVANLASLMSEFYREHRTRPVTTMQLEEHLVAKGGKPVVVDGFARFVYGLTPPSPVPDLWLRDDPGHTGADAWAGRFWDSPDLWIRHADDGGTTHEEPEFGQDNWFHARVRNRGATTARHFVVVFAVKPFAGVEFTYPVDHLPGIAAVAGFDLAPGEARVVRARWPRALVPPAGTHACWLATVLTPGDVPPAGAHTWEHNSLAQKNLTVVDVLPNRWFTLPFVMTAGLERRRLLELVRPKGFEALEARLVHGAGLKLPDARPLEPVAPPPRWRPGSLPPVPVGPLERQRRFVEFPTGPRSRMEVPPVAGQLALGLALRAPNAPAGTECTVDLVAREDGERGAVVGGVAVRLRIA